MFEKMVCNEGFKAFGGNFKKTNFSASIILISCICLSFSGEMGNAQWDLAHVGIAIWLGCILAALSIGDPSERSNFYFNTLSSPCFPNVFGMVLPKRTLPERLFVKFHPGFFA